MAAPGKMTVGKLALQMNRRFWEEDDDIYGGSSTLGIPGHTVIYPSYGYFGKKGIVKSSYPIGRPAVAFGELSLAEQVNAATYKIFERNELSRILTCLMGATTGGLAASTTSPQHRAELLARRLKREAGSMQPRLWSEADRENRWRGQCGVRRTM